MTSAKVFVLALVLAIAVLALACNGGETGAPGGAQGVTDPRSVPTSTPWATPPPVVYVEGGPVSVGAGGGTYAVQAGDTAYQIALDHGVTLEELAAANDMTLEEIANLSVGQRLVIPEREAEATPGVSVVTATPAGTPSPGVATPAATPTAAAAETPCTPGGTYVVQEGDYPAVIAEKCGISAEALMEANDITDPTSLVVGQELAIPTPTPSP